MDKMATMEGPLSKWTNVMKGWQYRWFVLDENSGLLSYYTSKEKMMRGARRGCVRLKGAVIGIDDEDESTFTITVDQKTFHFQARDADEKERWIMALQNTIERHSQPITRWEARPLLTLNDFDKKLAETDAYLQILIDQVHALETRIEECPDEDAKDKYSGIKQTAEEMIESIKQGIVLLQISKVHEGKRRALDGVTNGKQNACSDSPLINGSVYEAVETMSIEVPVRRPQGHRPAAPAAVAAPTPALTVAPQPLSKSSVDLPAVDTALPDDSAADTAGVVTSSSMPNLSSPSTQAPGSPTTSVASSADSTTQSVAAPAQPPQPQPPPPSADQPPPPSATVAPLAGSTLSGPSLTLVPEMSYSSSEDEDFFDAEDDMSGSGKHDNPGSSEPSRPPLQVIASKDDEFDELYDDIEEDDLESMDKHGSVITHLLSQVRIGMDLTKIVLPTFILEKRSLLEMYADFLAHPDLFTGIVNQKTPRDRMVQVVRWYLSAFHAGRRSSTAKKPYNPILGETFLCHYDLPGEDPTEDLVEDGPVRWATKNNVSFIAEQVSHHPPISAFYAEHYNKRISLDGYIWTKSKFLGLSIGVHMIGQAMVTVMDHDEEYMLTFPNGYGRSILTVPWVELGGKVNITCAQSGYNATVDFHTKPFYGGKKDRVTAEIYAPNEKKSFCSIEGEWNGVMYAKFINGPQREVFVNTKTMPIVKKCVRKLEAQDEYESRRLWQDVTFYLKNKNVEKATEAKHRLEQRQREEAKDRKERGAKWETKFFHEVGEHWLFDHPLHRRLTSTPQVQRHPIESSQSSDASQQTQSSTVDASTSKGGAKAAPTEGSLMNQAVDASLPAPIVPTVMHPMAQPAS